MLLRPNHVSISRTILPIILSYAQNLQRVAMNFSLPSDQPASTRIRSSKQKSELTLRERCLCIPLFLLSSKSLLGAIILNQVIDTVSSDLVQHTD